ncbi:MAG: SAM-dependent methyltransferase [Chloracidobacterium sp.]|nr:SAM-dependent methyltransferase [Chloracidobacterium sp.]
MLDTVENFLTAFAASLADGTFVKVTLGNYRGAEEHLQKLNIRLIETKKGRRLFFLYKYDTRDTAKNYDFDEGQQLIAKCLDGEFFSGHLFTSTADHQLEIGKKGRSRLNIAKPTFMAAPMLAHDRKKTEFVDRRAHYLRSLGITTDRGDIRDKQQDKWRQINKFVETLAHLLDKSRLKGRPSLRLVDMGSGKGYLTFAAYDYFANVRGLDVSMAGVDTRSELVSLCNDIAVASEFDGLRFVEGSIDSFSPDDVDILIALHACNTATDDAIYKGIRSEAELIVVAPCCHQELRPQITPPEMFRDVLKHGVMLERVAETVTDGLRSLLLERSGYSTRLFEFVAAEHTPKNNMLVGTKLDRLADPRRFDEQITAIKELYGITGQRLETLLA